MGLAVPSVLAALAAVRCAGPALLLAIVLSLLGLKRPQSPPATPIISVTISQTTPRRSVILSLLTVAAAAYLFDGVLVVTRAVLNHTWEGSDPAWSGIEVADVLGLLAFGGLATTGAWKDAKGVPVWQNSRVKIFAAVALAFELVNVVLIAVARPFLSKPPVGIPENPPAPGVILAPFVHFSLAILRLIALSLLYPALTHPVTRYVPSSSLPAVANGNGASVENLETPVRENAGLLAAPQAPGRSYGTFLPPPSTTPSIHTVTPAPTELGLHVKPTPRKDTPEDLSWSQAFAKIRKLAPYLWPSKNRWLQFLAFLCMIVLLLGRVVNFVLPFTLKELVDTFDKGTVNQSNPWALLLLYVFLKFLQGSGGLGALRDTLWAPVMQYSDREMSQLSFDHLLNLSLAFHTRRKTGEILRILDRGAAINHIFELLLFNIIPTIIDITVALVAFFYFFGPLLCAVVFLVMVSYVAASVVLTRWRTKLRREMNDRDMVTRGIHTDCLLNYETVKYFGGEAHEAERYRKAIEEYQVLEYKVIASLNFLNFVQNFIISTGLLVGSLIVGWRIVHANDHASHFVFFITYLAQLYGPLTTLGYIYRSINQNLVDTERLMNLLNEPTEVTDKTDAPELIVTDGVITFENVNFSYDGRTTALQDVSFTVPKGHSVALVGESGSGKSTILRLLFRQYDLKDNEGRILIDGQDIRDVTQASLRKAIGVVPQDSVLFNNSIGYNIGYGKFGASQDEIEGAAKAAQMHDRILTFPDGYETKVGERGVRLSGGEKQRVSIARTFLKNSPILVLDEATSALDTTTEKDIQKALQNLLQGRSSISIAHRLSTIASADIILVLKNGNVVEAGGHKELLSQNGVFAAMWAEQVRNEGVDQNDDLQAEIEEVKGYDTKPAVMPETEANPFLMPGPALVDLPPTVAEQREADQRIKDAAESTAPTKADASKEPSIKTAPQVDSPEGFTQPSIAPSVKESVKDTTTSPQEAVISLSDEPEEIQGSSSQPVNFPSSQPLAFPTSDDASSIHRRVASTESAASGSTPGITFKDTDSQKGSGDTPEKGEKRRRISSQNFQNMGQRLARRISIGRRQSSSASAAVQAAVAAVTGGSKSPPSTSSTPRPGTPVRMNTGTGERDSQDGSDERPGTPGSSTAEDKKKKPKKKGTLF